MKKSLLFRGLVLLALLTCAIGASAATESFTRDGIYYQLTTYSDGSGVVSVMNNGSFNTYSGVVNIPDSVYYNGLMYPVVSVGYQAFKNCTGLTAVTIPEGVRMLMNECFAGCTALTRITLPSTLSAIYNSTFTGCTSLRYITSMRETAASFNSNNFDANTYATAILMVPQGSLSSYQSTSAWSQFSNIQQQNKFVVDGIYYTITSGSTVSVTYRDANYCSYDGAVIIPSTVEHGGKTYTVNKIDMSAFRECKNPMGLEVIVPNTVTTIGDYAFYNSTLDYIELGTGVTSIGDYAFMGTESTLYVFFIHAQYPPTTATNTFPEGVYDNVYLWIPRMAEERYKTSRYWTSFNPDNMFYGYDFIVDGIYYGINSYSNTVEVSAYALHTDSTYLYSAYSTRESVVIPPIVTYEGTEYLVNQIGSYAFYRWGAKDITLPSTIKSIEPRAFRSCDSLEQINISEGVTRIGRFAFQSCERLQSVDIPHSVTSVDYGAFYDCIALQSLSLGAGLKQIGYYAFKSCSNLSTVTSYALVPPVSSDEGYSLFFAEETYQGATLYVPKSSLSAYQTAEGWRQFYNIEGITTLDGALNAPGGTIHFTDEGDYPWIVKEGDGRLYAQSSNAGIHSSESRFTVTVHVDEPSVLSFDFKAWGESDPDYPNLHYDESVFMVNGTSIFRYGARDNDWENFTYELNAGGTYQLVWFYHKDISDNGVGDYFAVDNIKIAPKATRGDVNGDGTVGIVDVTALIDYLLSGDESGINMTAADCNQDNSVGISDVTALIDYLLSGSW